MADNVVDFRRGPAHHQAVRTNGRDWTDSPEQRAALTVPCRACGAPEGVMCRTRDGGLLTRFPAHTKRTTDARARF